LFSLYPCGHINNRAGALPLSSLPAATANPG
jgi:hypothetical protein